MVKQQWTSEMMESLNIYVKYCEKVLSKWQTVADFMNSCYGTTFSKDAVRIQWRKQNGKTLVVQTRPTGDKDALLKMVSKRTLLNHVLDKFKITQDEALAWISRLQLEGYRGLTLWNEDGRTFVQNVQRGASVQVPRMLPTFGKEIKLGVVSDTHIGNKNFDKEALDYLYDYFEELGITTVLHVGDLTDGYYTNRPTSIMEQDAIGFTQQVNMVCDVYPRKANMRTFFITGNHDYTHTRNGMANVGEAVSAKRSDFIYLGHNFAKFPINDKSAISLIHPTDGTPTSLSLRLQQIIDKNEHRVSDIILVGHYHKFVQIYYKGVYGFLVPSLERQTGFMQDNNLTSLVGGLVLTIKTDDEGYILSVTTEYIKLD